MNPCDRFHNWRPGHLLQSSSPTHAWPSCLPPGSVCQRHDRPAVSRSLTAAWNDIAPSLAIAAAEAGRRVCYGTLAGLVESLTETKAAGNLSRRLHVLTHPALLVVDEIGYLPVNHDGAVLFFQLINARHERASTVLQQGLRGLGRRTRRRGNGRCSHRPGRAPLSYRQHPRQQQSDEGSPEPVAGRLGSTPQQSRGMNAMQSECRNGANHPLWITGFSPPDSRRSLRHPGYPQLHSPSTPPTPRLGGRPQAQSERFSIPKSERFSVGIDSHAAFPQFMRGTPICRPCYKTIGPHACDDSMELCTFLPSSSTERVAALSAHGVRLWRRSCERCAMTGAGIGAGHARAQYEASSGRGAEYHSSAPVCRN